MWSGRWRVICLACPAVSLRFCVRIRGFATTQCSRPARRSTWFFDGHAGEYLQPASAPAHPLAGGPEGFVTLKCDNCVYSSHLARAAENNWARASSLNFCMRSVKDLESIRLLKETDGFSLAVCLRMLSKPNTLHLLAPHLLALKITVFWRGIIQASSADTAERDPES